MFLGIKIRIEKELCDYAGGINKIYPLKKLSPILSRNIKEFILGEGKRIRPTLYCIGYLGFSKNAPAKLYRSALSLELLHDFLLVHDDIIDKSRMRRGRPSMHVLLEHNFCKNKKDKFAGEDLAIVVGDIIYAMAIDAFLTVKENRQRKEEALKKLISTALHTAGGEFIELLLASKELEKVNQKDIYKIYDYKTANYTFASPLAIGATLAGAKPGQIKKLHSYGMLLGRAFQIKDDIIGIFGKEKETGKSNTTDILEAKRTLLIWRAFNKTSRKNKLIIKKILGAKSVKNSELKKIRKIIVESGALSYAQNQIKCLYSKALNQINGLKMRKTYKLALEKFSRKTLF